MQSIRRTVSLLSLVVPGAIALGAAGPASADVITDYRFDNGSAASSDTELNSDAGDFGFSDTTNDGDSAVETGLSASSDSTFLRSDATGSTQNEALDDDDFFEFTVTADAGYELNLDDLALDGFSEPRGVTMTIYLQSSLGGFGSANPVIASGTFIEAPMTSPDSLTLDLGAAQFDGLSSITFRLFISDDKTQNNQIGRLDNIRLSGVVSLIPEPASVALLGLGALMIGARRRRGA